VSDDAWRNVPIYREVYTQPLVTLAQAEAMVDAERERCAKVCEQLDAAWNSSRDYDTGDAPTGKDCAAAIRGKP
jgi:hypothetical protein